VKKYIFTVIIFILSINVLAQNNIDSLEIKLKTVSGKERVSLSFVTKSMYFLYFLFHSFFVISFGGIGKRYPSCLR